jgi:predicted O-methyltransferase YrrM
MVRSREITDKQQYIRSLYCKDADEFEDVFHTADDKQGMQLASEEGKLLSILLCIHKAKHALEIGTFVGYSCCWIATSLPQDGSVITIEVDKKYFEIANRNFNGKSFVKKITTVNADAITYLKSLKLNYELDAVFIDGKKDEYPEYLKLLYPLVKIGGLIIADNTFLFGDIYKYDRGKSSKKRWEGMRKFNEDISDATKYKSLILPTKDGLTVAIKL